MSYPGFADNPEGRPVKSVRTCRFERFPSPTARTPNPEVQQVPMQFEAVPDRGQGMPGVLGTATIRGATYDIFLSVHDLQWMLSESEREVDLARAKDAIR